ncbi:hypothetical protein H1R20_g2670, partial [Candolleomyces eurysporus]
MPAIRNESTSKAKAATRSDPTGQTRSRGGNKPVQCEVCGKVLNRKPDLNRHMLIHNEDAQRWKCHYADCSFAAIQRSNLNTHLATHTKQKNHACPDCEYATSDPAALTRHRKRQHQYVPKSRRKMPNNNKGKAPEVQPSTCLEQQPVATDGQQQPVAGPSTMLVPATFTDYSSSPSPSPSASGSERHYSSEPYDPAATAGYSGYASPAASVETGDDYYYPSPLNSDDEAASVGGSRGGTPSSVSSASSSGSSSSGSPSPSRESSLGVGASSTGSRSASIPPPLPLQAQAGPSSGIVLMRTNPGSDDFIKQEEADVDWARQPPPQQPQDQAASPSGAGNFDFTQYLNTSNENLPQQAGAAAAAGLEDTTSSVWCVGTQPWMPEMSPTDGFNFVAQDPFQFESNLFLPTSTMGDCVPNISGLAWESSSSNFGFGGSYFGYDPVPSPSTSFIPLPRPARNTGTSMSRGVKIQQEKLQQQVYPTPTFSPSPSSSREVTPLFDLRELVGSCGDSWF